MLFTSLFTAFIFAGLVVGNPVVVGESHISDYAYIKN